MNYKNKYLKYKSKYLELKNTFGGSDKHFIGSTGDVLPLIINEPYLECNEHIKLLQLNKNMLSRTNWIIMHEKIDVKLDEVVLNNIKKLQSKTCTFAKEGQEHDCNMYVNKCKLAYLYEKYLNKKYESTVTIDESILNKILSKTIHFGELSMDDQIQLWYYGANLDVDLAENILNNINNKQELRLNNDVLCNIFLNKCRLKYLYEKYFLIIYKSTVTINESILNKILTETTRYSNSGVKNDQLALFHYDGNLDVRLSEDIINRINNTPELQLNNDKSCNIFINKGILKYLYEKYLNKKYESTEIINENVLKKILLKTLFFIKDYEPIVRDDQTMLNHYTENSITRIDNSDYSNIFLSGVILPNFFTYIGSRAFSFNQIDEIILPKSLTYIGDYAFENNQINEVSIPNSVTYIGHDAFKNNQISTLTIPNSVTYIGNGAFFNNRLKKVTIPNSVTYIGNEAFADNHLSEVIISIIPNFFMHNGENAFENNKLSTVTIPNSVTYIGDGAFKNNLLSTLTIHDSITHIGKCAFANNKLTTVTIPNSITHIDKRTFENNKLTTVIIPNSVTAIGKLAFFNNKLTTVTIPNSVTYIGDGAFQTNLLSTLTIHDSITHIGEHAFEYNKLTTVTIPNSVTYIGMHTFYNNELKTVTIPNIFNNDLERIFGPNYQKIQFTFTE